MSDTTVSFETEDGQTEPVSMDEFEQRAEDAIHRRRGNQLSFDVGLPGNKPDFGSAKVGGSFVVPRDLKRGQEVTVVISDMDGTVIASTRGTVTAISFKDKTDDYGITTERIHTITL